MTTTATSSNVYRCPDGTAAADHRPPLPELPPVTSRSARWPLPNTATSVFTDESTIP